MVFFKGESTAPGRAIRLLPLQLRVRIDRLGLAPAAYMRRLGDIPARSTRAISTHRPARAPAPSCNSFESCT